MTIKNRIAEAVAQAKKRWKKLQSFGRLGGSIAVDRIYIAKEEEKRDMAVEGGCDGDLSMYDRKNILKRKSLRSNEKIKSLIKELWEASVSVDGIDFDPDNGEMTKAGYLEISVRIAKVHPLMHEDRQLSCQMQAFLPGEFDEAEVREEAEEDWKHDAGGTTTMSYMQFFNAIFEVVDIWCDTVDEREYVGKLNHMVETVTEGRSRLKELDDIEYVEILTKDEWSVDPWEASANAKHGLGSMKHVLTGVKLQNMSQQAHADRLAADQLEAARLEAERLEAERLEAARLEAARLEAARLEAARLEAARLEAARLELQQDADGQQFDSMWAPAHVLVPTVAFLANAAYVKEQLGSVRDGVMLGQGLCDQQFEAEVLHEEVPHAEEVQHAPKKAAKSKAPAKRQKSNDKPQREPPPLGPEAVKKKEKPHGCRSSTDKLWELRKEGGASHNDPGYEHMNEGKGSGNVHDDTGYEHIGDGPEFVQRRHSGNAHGHHGQSGNRHGHKSNGYEHMSDGYEHQGAETHPLWRSAGGHKQDDNYTFMRTNSRVTPRGVKPFKAGMPPAYQPSNGDDGNSPSRSRAAPGAPGYPFTAELLLQMLKREWKRDTSRNETDRMILSLASRFGLSIQYVDEDLAAAQVEEIAMMCLKEQYNPWRRRRSVVPRSQSTDARINKQPELEWIPLQSKRQPPLPKSIKRLPVRCPSACASERRVTGGGVGWSGMGGGPMPASFRCSMRGDAHLMQSPNSMRL